MGKRLADKCLLVAEIRDLGKIQAQNFIDLREQRRYLQNQETGISPLCILTRALGKMWPDSERLSKAKNVELLDGIG